jgi:AcrR family transcriptional regulator
MSSEVQLMVGRVPKRARGKQRVAELLEAAAEVFAKKGYAAATMTEIAARAGAPIGSLYQFFPVKEALADTLVQNYAALMSAELQALQTRASCIDVKTLVERLFNLMRGHPRERAVALPLAEARMDAPTRRSTLRRIASRSLRSYARARRCCLPPLRGTSRWWYYSS